MNEKRMAYAHWLYEVPGIGNKTIASLLAYAGEEEAVYRLEEKELERLLKPKQRESFLKCKKEREPYENYEKLKRRKILFYPNFHEEFPNRLKKIPDSPYAIYVLGQLPKEETPSVAIIGARECSEYGRKMARQFAGELSKEGILTVSGMARGIDGAAQRATLEAGGKSYGVLGCGVDICYPGEHRELYEALKEKGGILSEYIPKTEPKAGYFPPRNRIISGLSDILLVIEARERSGTSITVDMALEQGKEVFMIPGRVTDSLSAGCNRLIKQGAGIALSPEDILEELGQRKSKKQEEPNKVFDSIMEEKIFSVLDDLPLHLYDVERRLNTKITVPELTEKIVLLLAKGYICEKGKNYYFRK